MERYRELVLLINHEYTLRMRKAYVEMRKEQDDLEMRYEHKVRMIADEREEKLKGAFSEVK